MTEPQPVPEGGRFVPTSVLNWYEVVDTTSDISIIDTAFANPVNEVAISIEEPHESVYVLNQLAYDDWSEVIRELHGEESWTAIREYANKFMGHHSHTEPTEGQQTLGELFG